MSDKPQHLNIDGDTLYTKAHPKDFGADRVEVTMEPRWKESELSGDEWRWSIRATAYRKGQVIADEGGLSLFDALIQLLPRLKQLEGAGFLPLDECAQPECQASPTVLYRLTKEWSKNGMYEGKISPSYRVRPFCARHTRRGDCALEDADVNYTPVAWMVDGTWTSLPTVAAGKDE